MKKPGFVMKSIFNIRNYTSVKVTVLLLINQDK